MSRNYEEIKRGLATTLSISQLTGFGAFQSTDKIAGIKAQLVLFALPRASASPNPKLQNPMKTFPRTYSGSSHKRGNSRTGLSSAGLWK